jgi:hypothetical protein
MQIHIYIPPVTARVINNLSKKNNKRRYHKITPLVECGLLSNSNSYVDAHLLFLFIISVNTGRWKIDHIFENKY